MEENNVIGYEGQEQKVDPLTELLRKGASQIIYRAVEAELQELMSGYSEQRTEDGKAGVVRNGYHPEQIGRAHV